jgi:hypothetical protein
MEIAESDYLAMDGSMDNVSYLQRGTDRCSLIGLKSTMWRNPPVLLGSRRDADTQGVGCCTGTTAPSSNSFGSSCSLQNDSSSSDQLGLWLWKCGGGELKGKVTPVFIHLRINLGAPAFAQKGRLCLTLRCIPFYLKSLLGLVINSGCHFPSKY